MLYDQKLSSAAVSSVPASADQCPARAAQEATRYESNNVYSPAETSWSLHWPPYQAFAEQTWVEVMRQRDPFGDEHFGAWFVYAKGSGIWLNTGATVAFDTHWDAYKQFDVTTNEAIWMALSVFRCSLFDSKRESGQKIG